jgi:hypothetical protein
LDEKGRKYYSNMCYSSSSSVLSMKWLRLLVKSGGGEDGHPAVGGPEGDVCEVGEKVETRGQPSSHVSMCEGRRARYWITLGEGRPAGSWI